MDISSILHLPSCYDSRWISCTKKDRGVIR
jgi:hypothetical protein